MYFLAGSIFLLAFATLSRGETCSQVMDCLKHAQNIKPASETGNVDAMCDMQKKMVDCFSSALADCQSSGSSIASETLEQFQNTMNDARKKYERACAGRGGSSGSSGNTGGGDGGMTYNTGSGSGTVPKTASCGEAAKCAFDISKMQEALNENRLKDVCNMVTPSARCMKSAFNDCKENKVLPEMQLNAMSEQVKQIDSIIEEHCAGGASGIGVSAVFMTMISALAFIVVRLF